MNTYHRYNTDDDDGVHYVELDQEFYCLRSIFLREGTYKTSNIHAEDYFLPEGSFLGALDNLIAIEESEFNTIWNIALGQYRLEWIRTKEKIYPGLTVVATIICFYPQGVIMDVGAKFLGILLGDDCTEVFGEENQYPGNSNEFRVTGFVEEQMWITLEPV